MSVVRTLASYLPGPSLLGLRRFRDMRSLRSQRPHEVDFLAFRSFVLERPSVIDVGANRGQSIESFIRVMKEPQITAFEPNLELASYLAKRYESTGVVVHRSGLGASNATVRLYLPRYGNTVWDTRGSLDEDAARLALSPSQFWRFRQDRAGVEEMDVDIRKLDDFGLSPTVLKIDVEGTEDAVIQGGLSTIREHQPIILAEGELGVSSLELKSMGYLPHRFDEDRGAFIRGELGMLNTFHLCDHHYSMFGVPVVAGY